MHTHILFSRLQILNFRFQETCKFCQKKNIKILQNSKLQIGSNNVKNLNIYNLYDDNSLVNSKDSHSADMSA